MPEPRDIPTIKESETLAGDNEYPTPEATPERTTTQEPTQEVELTSNTRGAARSINTAPRASEVSRHITEAHVLPQGTQRSRKPTRKEAYFTALDDIEDLSGFHSAFTAALAQGKMPHRDTLPPEPRNWKEMLSHPYASQWKQAAQVEFDELWRQQTFIPVALADIPQELRQILPLLWVFKYKFDTDGYLDKFKARICVRGDLQNTSQDTYAATLAFRTFRALMAITAAYDLEIVQLDAVNAFLNAPINEETFIQYPEGYKKPGQALRLLRALYGLRQSPLLWYKDLTATLKELGLVEVPDANCLLTNHYLTVFFYVDDIIILYHSKDSEQFESFLQRLQQRYRLRRLQRVN